MRLCIRFEVLAHTALVVAHSILDVSSSFSIFFTLPWDGQWLEPPDGQACIMGFESPSVREWGSAGSNPAGDLKIALV